MTNINQPSEKIKESFDRRSNKLYFSIRDHLFGQKNHIDISIGYPKNCVEFFSGRSSRFKVIADNDINLREPVFIKKDIVLGGGWIQ